DDNPKSLTGVKKVPLRLNPPAALIYMAMGFKDGARKYGPYNWRTNKVAASVYIDAIERHIQAYKDGQDTDESGGPVLGHILACAAILADATESGNLIDDRPPAGPASRLLAEFTEKEKA
ncbi:MAG: hypothetical protein J3T61_10420, partial [Candidatus Brocadiales bacterium]|nr:hypothetical protein [Candidatus Bathyanammoxibius sp.]